MTADAPRLAKTPWRSRAKCWKGSPISLEQALQEIVHELPPHKQRELFDYASRLHAEGAKKPPFRSIEGLWAHLGISLSAEEIDENQREMWCKFPREDI